MPLGTKPSVHGYVGYDPDPTVRSQYGAAAGATPATPEANAAAKTAALAMPGTSRTRKTMLFMVEIPAIATPGTTTDYNLPNDLVDRAGTVVDAVFIPNGALTGQATNFRTWSLVNKGPAGAGNTSMGAGFASSSAGNSLEDGNPESLVVTVGAVAAGDRLTVRSAATGTGQADPGGWVAFWIDRA